MHAFERLVLLCAVALVCVAARSHAQTVAVVELKSPPGLLGLAGQVLQHTQKAARELGFKVIPPEDVRALLGERGLEQLKGCAGQAGCMAEKLSGVRADRAVVGELGRDEKSYLLRLWLVDLKGAALVSSVDRQILIASRRFSQDVRAALPPFLRGEKEPMGTLVVTSNVKRAQVAVDGEPRGEAPVTLQLKPGKHDVRVERANHLPVQRLVTVEAGQTAREEIRLLLQPGAAAEADDAPAVSQAKPSAAGAGWKVPLPTWIAAGAALAVTGVGAYFGARSAERERRLERSFDAERGVYGGTRRQALDAQRDAVLANTFFVAAGAAAVTGGLFWLFADDGAPAARAVRWSPALSPSAVGLTGEASW